MKAAFLENLSSGNDVITINKSDNSYEWDMFDEYGAEYYEDKYMEYGGEMMEMEEMEL